MSHYGIDTRGRSKARNLELPTQNNKTCVGKQGGKVRNGLKAETRKYSQSYSLFPKHVRKIKSPGMREDKWVIET